MAKPSPCTLRAADSGTRSGHRFRARSMSGGAPRDDWPLIDAAREKPPLPDRQSCFRRRIVEGHQREPPGNAERTLRQAASVAQPRCASTNAGSLPVDVREKLMFGDDGLTNRFSSHHKHIEITTSFQIIDARPVCILAEPAMRLTTGQHSYNE